MTDRGEARESTSDGVRAETLLADVDRLRGTTCSACARIMGPHALLAAIWLGLKNAPRCAACVGCGLGRDPVEYAAHVRGALMRRDCYREAWEIATDRGDVEAGRAEAASPTEQVSSVAPETPDAELTADESWNAGDLGCGDLVLELRGRLRAMPPGRTLLLTARDPGAREDIPAWCGLTGHRLLRAAHPDYLIRRKEG